MRLEQAAVLELLPDVSGKTALDLACGSGRYLNLLRERGAASAVGIDLSPQMLFRARQLTAVLAQADLSFIPFPPSTFDVVVCGLAVGHVSELARALAEMSRVLGPGGIVVYSDFHPFGRLAEWKRNFRAADGREYAVQHHDHLYADHHAACQSAGLTVEAVREPLIDVDHPWRGCPAALVIRARKVVNE
jgi:malonyl-CoA O-methyltransferase